VAAPLAPPVRTIAAGGLIGFGVAAWADELVFYHLLAWNNRVNTSTFELGQVLDNAVHAAGVFTPLFGLVVAAGARRTGGPFWRALLGGTLLGAAFFRLVDILVEHASTKLLQSHNPAEIALYDHVWSLVAWPLLCFGLLTLAGARPALRPQRRTGRSRAREAAGRLAGDSFRASTWRLRASGRQLARQHRRAWAALKGQRSS
jgi:uncharacterized membrane protein